MGRVSGNADTAPVQLMPPSPEAEAGQEELHLARLFAVGTSTGVVESDGDQSSGR